MDNAGRDSIIKRLEFAESELSDLDAYQDLDYSRYSSDRVTRRNVERIIENVINSLSDIGKIILSQYDTEMPESYASVFMKLGALGLIGEDLSNSLAGTARLRNILAHQYLDIKWDHIKSFLIQGRIDARKFLNAIEKRLLSEGSD